MIEEKLIQLFRDTREILHLYMNFNYRTKHFLWECKPLSQRILSNTIKPEFHTVLPFFKLQRKLHLSFTKFGAASVSASVDMFWNSMNVFMPHLSMLVNKYKDYVTNGADVERSASLYKCVLSARRSMRESKFWYFLNYNPIALSALNESVHQPVTALTIQSWVLVSHLIM